MTLGTGIQITVLLLIAGLFSGCQFEEPLAEPMGLPIDPSVLGSWTKLNEHGEVGPKASQISIFPFGEAFYLVIDRERDPQYFRAYPVHLNGVDCVQMELLADMDEARRPDDKEKDEKPTPYMLVKYQIEDGRLTVWDINPEILTEDMNSTEALQKAFQENASNPVLFLNETVYIR